MQNRVPAFTLLGGCQDTLGALAPCSGFLHSRPARHLSAVHDAWRVTLKIRVHQAPRGKIRRELPSLYTEALGKEKGKNNLQRLGTAPKGNNTESHATQAHRAGRSRKI